MSKALIAELERKNQVLAAGRLDLLQRLAMERQDRDSACRNLALAVEARNVASVEVGRLRERLVHIHARLVVMLDSMGFASLPEHRDAIRALIDEAHRALNGEGHA